MSLKIFVIGKCLPKKQSEKRIKSCHFLSRVDFGVINADDFSNALAVNSRTLFPNIEIHTAKNLHGINSQLFCQFSITYVFKEPYFAYRKNISIACRFAFLIDNLVISQNSSKKVNFLIIQQHLNPCWRSMQLQPHIVFNLN